MWNVLFCQQSPKSRNQDALFNGEKVYQFRQKIAEKWELNQSHLIVGIADGVSSSPTPAFASRFFMEQLSQCEKLTSSWIRQKQQQFCEQAEFGSSTTFVATELNENGRGKLFNVGDSRAYLINNGNWQQLSFDHTFLNKMLPEQAVKNSEKFASIYNVLCDCLIADPMENHFCIHSAEFQLTENNCLLLCSDGLTNFVPEFERLSIWRDKTSLLEKLNAFRKYVKRLKIFDDLSILVVTLKTNNHTQE